MRRTPHTEGKRIFHPQLGIFSSNQAAIREISFRKGVRLVFCTLQGDLTVPTPPLLLEFLDYHSDTDVSCEDAQYIFCRLSQNLGFFREALSEMAKRCKSKLSHYIRVSIKTPINFFPAGNVLRYSSFYTNRTTIFA